MSGTADLCDARDLAPGASCLVVVDDVNCPTGNWVGRVVDRTVHERYVEVRAVLTSYLDGRPLSAETQAHTNYRVYPDTPTLRYFLRKVENLRASLRSARSDLHKQRKDHLDTIEQLARRLTVPVTNSAV